MRLQRWPGCLRFADGSHGADLGSRDIRQLTALDEHLSPKLTLEDRCALMRFMLLQRAIEERGLTLYKLGKVPGSFYDGRGQEAVSVGATFPLGPDDPYVR